VECPESEEHCICKARLRLPFGGAFREPVMERLERGLQECLCTGWDVIENPYYCNRGLEEIAASNLSKGFNPNQFFCLKSTLLLAET